MLLTHCQKKASLTRGYAATSAKTLDSQIAASMFLILIQYTKCYTRRKIQTFLIATLMDLIT